MHHFFFIFSLLAIIGHVSGQTTGNPWERIIDGRYRSELTVTNGMTWGLWGCKSMCPRGRYAAGFSLRVEKPSSVIYDNTALNGIRLHCVSRSKESSGSHDYTTIESDLGNWGEWTDIKWCGSGFLKDFQLRVQSDQGFGFDDTAANNIRFTCSDGFFLQGKSTNWGDWGNWSPKCKGTGICGIQTRIEDPRGIRDDTALNDVRMFCCD
ncbi:vitelline membrane outer layer protein 1-like isoform X2 [Siphateles boraxobius]|uniref:vitelline membrane outer layer protein 1-like isoform X2 n=1 Tax=Siphateles boraxobius TaxID=180520 RepID=UPI0040631D3E